MLPFIQIPPQILAIPLTPSRSAVLVLLCFLAPTAAYVLETFIEALGEARHEMRRMRAHGWPIAMRVTSFPLALGFMFLARLRGAI